LATWVAKSAFSDIPEIVLEKARMLTLDAIGCGLHGIGQEWSSITTKFAISMGGRADSAIWGTRHRVPAIMAPLVNGTSVHAFEFDDLHPQAVIHAGAQVVPVAMAVAEMLESEVKNAKDQTGESVPSHLVTESEFLHAIVLGFEVGARIGLATGAGQLARGFHPSPNTATFAAAATACRLLRLDARLTTSAFGIAGSFGGYLMAAQHGAMVKRLHPGHSGQSGLVAALLAARGLTGTDAVIEIPYGGFASTYSDASPAQVARISQDLGDSWEVPQYTIKMYPCCGSNHTSLEAWWALSSKYQLKPSDIESLEIRCSTLTLNHVGWPYVPAGVTAAQMNLRYCLAAAIVDNRLTVEQFKQDRLADSEILGIINRISVVADDEIDKLGRHRRHFIELRVSTRDGRHLLQTGEHPRGSAKNPPEPAQVVEKFRALAGTKLQPDQVDAIQKIILTLATRPDSTFRATSLTTIMAAQSKTTSDNSKKNKVVRGTKIE
jgi:2-methylcitrate dehydratase PrpD